MRRSLTKEERLRKQVEIKNLFSIGKTYSCKGMKIWYADGNLKFSRVLFSPSRNYATAVARNLAKRQAREIYRHVKEKVKSGHDMIFVFYPGSFTFQERQEQMIGLLLKTRLLTDS